MFPFPAEHSSLPCRTRTFMSGINDFERGRSQSTIMASSLYRPTPDSFESSAISSQDVWSIVRRRAWIVVLLIAVSFGVAHYVSRQTPREWRAQAQMILVKRSAPVVTVNQSGGGGSNTVLENVDTQVALIKTTGMAWRTINYLKNEAVAKRVPQSAVPQVPPQELQKQIDADPITDTDLFQVSVEAGSREEARRLADAVCRAFIEWKKELATKSARETLTALEARAETARKQMLVAEARELSFKNRSGLVNVTQQQQAILEQYLQRKKDADALAQEVTIKNQEYITLGAALNNMNSAIKQGGGSVRDDALVQSLQQQVNALEVERAVALSRYTREYPGPDGPTQIEKRLRPLKRSLAAALKRTLNGSGSLQSQGELTQRYRQAQIELRGIKAKQLAAQQAAQRLGKQAAGIPKASMEYARIDRNAELARQLYTSLEASVNAARLDRDAANGNVDIAYNAFAPEKPIRPDYARDMTFGGAAGLLLSALCLFLLEQSDKRVRNLNDMRRLVDGPIIGTIPALSRSEVRSLMQGQATPRATEAYSMLRANLSLIMDPAFKDRGADSGAQVMLVTSALPGEGKSFTAAQLARSMARSGKQVVLVDADLRRPTQNRLFHMKEPLGLANVLDGSVSLQDALVASDTANLTLLQSGSSEQNATELISSLEMAEVIDTLRAECDILIIDAPACAVVADALFLAPYVDSVLHVVGAGQVDSALVRDTTAALAAAAPKIIAYLMNRAPVTNSSSYKYYRAYRTLNTAPRGFIAASGAVADAPAAPAAETPADVEEEETRS